MYTTVIVKQILERKGNNVWSIDSEATVYDALSFMAEKNIGALLVTEESKPVGIFSERDYARKLVLKGKDEGGTQVKDVMTDQVIVVELDRKIEECLALMTGKFIRHLPVVNKDREIVGIISIGDVVKELISEQTFLIDQLVNYITENESRPPIPKKSEVEISEI
jgi:CBS domain-containing protein